jgi:hypothetical protein
MRFQVVLQWPLSTFNDFDELMSLEGLLTEKLSKQSEVDGYDFGSGEANIFVDTDDPYRTLKEVQGALSGHKLGRSVVIAYRETLGTEYAVLWPEGTTGFRVG